MPEWIDFALLGTERDLDSAIAGLDADACDAVAADLAAFLRADVVTLKRSWLRLLVERVRPLALPAALWTRSLTASSDIEALLRAHFVRLGVDPTADRISRGQQLYLQFADDRARRPVTPTSLAAQGYRCGHCGLAFCDEDLADEGITSPHGARGAPKRDPLKPHWHADRWRVPTMDHHWPVSMYGSNDAQNLRVLCKACNTGKADYTVWEQMRAFAGMPRRHDLLGRQPLSLDMFYAQIWRAPQCSRTGRDATTAELTVELRDPLAPAVLDNLITVESPGL